MPARRRSARRSPSARRVAVSSRMTQSRFATLLQEQVGHEFAASQQYIAIAVYFDSEALEQLAARFYTQALEERDHAMMMVQYLMDAGLDAPIPGVQGPR